MEPTVALDFSGVMTSVTSFITGNAAAVTGLFGLMIGISVIMRLIKRAAK